MQSEQRTASRCRKTITAKHICYVTPGKKYRLDHNKMKIDTSLESRFDDVGIALGSFWDQFVIILGSCWNRFGIVLESRCDNFGIMLGSIGDHFGMVLEEF